MNSGEASCCCWHLLLVAGRLAVLESGLGLESGLKSFFTGLGLWL